MNKTPNILPWLLALGAWVCWSPGAWAATAATTATVFKKTVVQKVNVPAKKSKSQDSIDISFEEFPASSAPSGAIRREAADRDANAPAPVQREADERSDEERAAARRPGARQGYVSDPAGNKVYDDGTRVRTTLPASGGYSQSAAGRHYNDGTFVDTSGYVRSIDGRPVSGDVRAEELRSYMRSKPGTSVQDAIQALRKDAR